MPSLTEQLEAALRSPIALAAACGLFSALDVSF